MRRFFLLIIALFTALLPLASSVSEAQGVTWVRGYPQRAADGCVEYVAQWSDGTYTATPWNCPTGTVARQGTLTATRGYPQRNANGCVEYVTQWSDGSYTWVPFSCPAGVSYTKPVAGSAARAATGASQLPHFGVTGPLNTGSLTAAQELGAGLYTLGIFWHEIEPVRTNPPTYHWAKYDRLFAQFQAVGVRPFVVLTSNPTWAYQGDRKLLTPTGRQGLAEVAAALVQRYGDTGAVWSLYNEPDCNGPTVIGDQFIPSTCWGDYGDQYTAMLRAVYPAIKAVDPNALVAIGGLAYDNWGPEAFAADFLDDVLASGGGHYFDLFNFHYYTEFADQWTTATEVDVAGKLAHLQGRLARYGLEKPVIVSEISKHGRVTGDENTQASYLLKGYTRALAAGAESVIWYNLRDEDWDPYGFGLLYGNGAEKPAARAYYLLAEHLTNARLPGRNRSLQVSGGEAYEFALDNGRYVLIGWSDTGGSVTIPTHSVTVESVFQGQWSLQDSADGRLDGRVTVPFSSEPLVIRWTLPSL